MKRIAVLVVLSVLIVSANLLPQGSAAADTKYSAYGWGRTYRNNFTTSCIWWGFHSGQSTCSLGVWSDTQSFTSGNVVEVKETAENIIGSCQGVVCLYFYAHMSPDPAQFLGSTIAATGGIHYDSDPWPSDTIGYACHINHSFGSSYCWWTSDGY